MRGNGRLVQFPALLRSSELFSLTWSEVLFAGNLCLQPYGLATAGILVRGPKTVLHIVEQQFVPIL